MTYLTLSLDDYETPVAMMSISISPVIGSVALYYMAVLINLTASSISLFSMTSLNLILATASANLIVDSSYLGVAVIVFFELPRLLMLV
jgi:hypothetical protein